MEAKIIKKNIKIVGSNKGLGKFLSDQLNLNSINRNASFSKINNLGSVIITARSHWSFTSQKYFEDCLQDNFLLIEKIISRKPKLICYISSIDVYQKIFPCKKLDNYALYPIFKLASENLIINSGIPYIILRPGLLINNLNINNNSSSLINIILNKKIDSLSLSSNSSFYPVTYEYFLKVLNYCLNSKITGIVDVVTKNKITLDQVSKIFKRKPIYGKYAYFSYSKNKIKSWKMDSSLNITSEDAINMISNNLVNN